MSTPRVSIIIPCHNAAPWLEATLESALSQSWGNKEIILTDDGSSDESLAIARRYESRGVIVFSQANRGASVARNRGLEKATGDYIQFLDADDLLAPDKLEVQISILNRRGSQWLASGEWGRFSQDPEETVFKPDSNWKDLTGLEFLLLHYEFGCMMHPAAWLVSRRLLDQVGPWDESLTLNDDGEFFGRLVLAAEGIVFCAGARSYYRSGLSGSLSRRQDIDALKSLWKATELNCQRLVAASDTARSRAAAANGWRRLAFECYPGAPDLSLAAEQRCQALGGSPFPMPAGPKFHSLACLIGWRAAKRMRDGWIGLRQSRRDRQQRNG